ncbi:RidA family protein [Paenibacillus spongiae]|uniref:RidA family protein n=1 Tax=Paenibacillus spongiae TaxID=2909671 RepID=A0ABY5SFR5_9BACL|nr:RidA family protein [Paenibacillus spongiae]UVI31350.1 RidA family protein [Paenibacillus spongiae]
MSKAIQVDQAPQFPLPFSHAIRSGDFVYVSGQVGVDPSTGQVVGESIEEQTKQCLRNIAIILKAEGLTLDHVVKVNAYVRADSFPGYNAAYRESFNEPFPARTSVPCDLGAYLVEIDVVAYSKSVRGN